MEAGVLFRYQKSANSEKNRWKMSIYTEWKGIPTRQDFALSLFDETDFMFPHTSFTGLA